MRKKKTSHHYVPILILMLAVIVTVTVMFGIWFVGDQAAQFKDTYGFKVEPRNMHTFISRVRVDQVLQVRCGKYVQARVEREEIHFVSPRSWDTEHAFDEFDVKVDVAENNITGAARSFRHARQLAEKNGYTVEVPACQNMLVRQMGIPR